MIHKYVTRFIKNYKINTVVKIFIVSDFIIWSSHQFFSPIFAIFVTDNLYNGNIEVVGFAAGIYLFSKSIFEIPVGIFIDKKKGELDNLYFAFFGALFGGVVIFLFNFITKISELYFLQMLLGISTAIAYPGWCSIFTKHLDEEKEGFEWSLYDVLVALGMALTSALGGVIAQNFGFFTVFTLSSILIITGSFLLLLVKNKLYVSKK